MKTMTSRRRRAPAAVLFDRGGTLVIDVPYNGDPALVRTLPGARKALERLRSVGVRTGVVTNQSGVALGLVEPEGVRAVNARVEDLLGHFDTWQVCPHAPQDGCRCRKPKAGLILAACRQLGLAPHDVVVIGDLGRDMCAARRAGARGILVPSPATLRREILEAPTVAGDLWSAVTLALGPDMTHLAYLTTAADDSPSMGSAA
ncbi:D-glycero-alpha-D-manno-heptose-1,7-bisphosphate 7-phosphatase [Sinomonas cyclohexanicum]|nr:HAD-IIIA family hydrolase [Corynebacterium cyclohexanicum]